MQNKIKRLNGKPPKRNIHIVNPETDERKLIEKELALKRAEKLAEETKKAKM